jgi:hypothetical protein
MVVADLWKEQKKKKKKNKNKKKKNRKRLRQKKITSSSSDEGDCDSDGGVVQEKRRIKRARDVDEDEDEHEDENDEGEDDEDGDEDEADDEDAKEDESEDKDDVDEDDGGTACESCGLCYSSSVMLAETMFLCDRCNKGYHVKCMHDDVRFITAPTADWFCEVCVCNKPRRTGRGKAAGVLPFHEPEGIQVSICLSVFPRALYMHPHPPNLHTRTDPPTNHVR